MTHNTPAPVADKALAERLARLADAAQGDGLGDGWPLKNAMTEAHRSGQLITLAEAQAMVAAERERCAALMETGAEAFEILKETMAASALRLGARSIRAAVTGTKEGM